MSFWDGDVGGFPIVGENGVLILWQSRIDIMFTKITVIMVSMFFSSSKEGETIIFKSASDVQ